MLKQVWMTAVALIFALAAGSASAQYKWVDAKGRVGYGDRPPEHVRILRGPQSKRAALGHRQAARSSNGKLHYLLQRVVDKAPVVLYSTPNCSPCDLARLHLQKRGVPYHEKIVASGHDIVAFTELGFPNDTGLPVMTTGNGRNIGYHSAQWDRTLDSAGYPRQSSLPAQYAWQKAEALASASQTVRAAKPSDGLNVQRSNVLARQRKSPNAVRTAKSNIRF